MIFTNAKIVVNTIIIFLSHCLGKYDIIYFYGKLSNLQMLYIIAVDLQIILIPKLFPTA